MKKRIHVNRQAVVRNRRTGGKEPVFSVKTYKGTEKGTEVVVKGPSRLVYRPERPLSCGAVAWVETEAEVEVR